MTHHKGLLGKLYRYGLNYRLSVSKTWSLSIQYPGVVQSSSEASSATGVLRLAGAAAKRNLKLGSGV